MAALGAKAGGQNEVGCCWVADVTSVLFTTLCQEKVSVGCWHGGQSLPRSNRERLGFGGWEILAQSQNTVGRLRATGNSKVIRTAMYHSEKVPLFDYQNCSCANRDIEVRVHVARDNCDLGGLPRNFNVRRARSAPSQ